MSPNYFVLNTSQIYHNFDSPNPVQNHEGIQQLIENDSKYVVFCRSGLLMLCDQQISLSVTSVLYDEKLLELIDTSNQIHISYDGNHTQHEIEPKAQLLYFTKKIHSIVTQMDRGNIEVNAPHVIVESWLSALISKHEYIESLNASKKYQIPFSRFIQLGKISVEKLCQQIPNAQMRQFLACLTPLKSETDLHFILEFLSLMFGSEVTFNLNNSEIQIPNYNPSSTTLTKFSDSILICLVLLNNIVSAIKFACSFSSSDIIKSSIGFLLTLYDNDSLFDLSYKTYDTKCIASVGLLTMKEPSSYVPFIERVDKIENPDLRKAMIDEEKGDSASAISHYSKCGSDYDEKCLYIITRDNLYDVGLDSYPSGSDIWRKIIDKKLEYLVKNNRPQKEIALAALKSNDPETFMRYIRAIVKSNEWQIILPRVEPQHYESIRDALIDEKRIEDAAYFTLVYMRDAATSKELYMRCHRWMKAVECGASREEVADGAFDILMKEIRKNIGTVQYLRKRFEEISEKQREHPESAKRKGKARSKRGLPAIVAQMVEMLPDKERMDEIAQVCTLLRLVGGQSKADELNKANRELVRAIWPIPHLPENEEMVVPQHLQGII